MPTRSQLGVIATADEDVTRGLKGFRYVEHRTPVEYDDWTIDGRPLRGLVPLDRGFPPTERTFMRAEAPYRPYLIASLRALLGESSTDGPSVHFDDGRVGILFCGMCGSMDCATLSASVEIDADSVTWRDIAFQVAYDPFTLDDQEPMTFVFERRAYEALIRGLLSALVY